MSKHMLPLISSWSGGKDSCLACYEALQAGHQMKDLLNFMSGNSCFHGIPIGLVELQAHSMGIPLHRQSVSTAPGDYEKEFKNAVQKLKSQTDIQGMVFGDMYLDEHNVCESIIAEIHKDPAGTRFTRDFKWIDEAVTNILVPWK